MKVNEIFQSISGEVGDIPQGAITWFIRFQGCNLRCKWCDTAYSQGSISEQMQELSSEQVADRIPEFGNVILTGGEPLLQPRIELEGLRSLLLQKGCKIQIETNGSVKPFLHSCHVIDYKTPSSGMQDEMMQLTNFVSMRGSFKTWIKFVVKTVEDLGFSVSVLESLQDMYPGWLGVRIALSIPNGEGVAFAMDELKKHMPESLLPKIVFNFQLHKHFNLD